MSGPHARKPATQRLRLQREDPPQEGGLNTTSMTDVIFILLVFFIALSEIRTQSIDLDVPSVSAAETEEPIEEGPPAVIEIARDGALLLDGDALELGALIGRLAARPSADGRGPRIRIRGDKDANYQRFVEVIAALGERGLDRIEIAVQAKR